VKVEDRSIKVTISIGLAGLTDTTDSGHSILKHSDELLYIAKRNGRDQLVCAGDDVSSDPLGKKAA